MRILIANGAVVSNEKARKEDVLIEGEQIVAVGTGLDRRVDRIIDASARLVLPGGVDPHTHLDMPAGPFTTSDDFESGTRAAAVGGTTTIIDFANPEPSQSLHDALDAWRRKAEHRAVVDFAFHVTVPRMDAGIEAEMGALIREGYPSFKLFMAYPGRLMVDDGAILRALRQAAGLGGLVCLHAENGPVIAELVRVALAAGHKAPRYHAFTRPPVTETEAVVRACVLAGLADAPVYLVHLSTAESVETVASARRNGLRVFGETCPQYLLLSDAEYERAMPDAAGFVMSPPLRPPEHQPGLWRGLVDGDVDVVATDHCPFMLRGQKDAAPDFSTIPNGAPGIEHRLRLLFDSGVKTGRLSLPRLVDLVSTAPARLFGLYPRKGTIREGSDADIVIFDPEANATISAATHQMRVDYDLFEGRTVAGRVVTVLSRGQIVVEDGRFIGHAGYGRLLRRVLPSHAAGLT